MLTDWLSPVDVAPACRMECSGGELSDSGSSGCWSWDRGTGSPVPSPPIGETDSSLAPPPDEGLDMEMEQVLFDEPAPRKRKVRGVTGRGYASEIHCAMNPVGDR